MIQCKDCELYRQEADGRRIFLCDPFNNIKEPECLAKWQLLRLDMIATAQNKILKYIKRELDDIDESEKWKTDDDTETDTTDVDSFDGNDYPDFRDNSEDTH